MNDTDRKRLLACLYDLEHGGLGFPTREPPAEWIETQALDAALRQLSNADAVTGRLRRLVQLQEQRIVQLGGETAFQESTPSN